MEQTLTLAVPQPQLPPTAEEQAAVEEAKRRHAAPLSEKRLAELAARGKKDEPAPKPDPVIERMKAEIAAEEKRVGL